VQIICTSLQTTTPATHHLIFYRPDAVSDAKPTVLKHGRQLPVGCNDDNRWSRGHIACRAVIEDQMITFAVNTTADNANAFEWAGQFAKIAPPVCGSRPHLIDGSLGPCQSNPQNQHLDGFSCFCRYHECDQQTHRPTMLFCL